MLIRAPQSIQAYRRHFLVGFAFSIFGCSLASGLILYFPHFIHPARAAAPAGSARLGQDSASARLLSAAGPGLVIPLPNARLVICKEYSQLDLYAGERFVKRYPVGLDPTRTPEGKFSVAARELPRGSGHGSIRLSPSAPAIDDSGTSISTSGNIGMKPDDLAEVYIATSDHAPVIIEK